MIKILKHILLLVFFFLSFNQVEAQGTKCLYPSFAKDFKDSGPNSEFLAFCKNHKNPLAQYETLFNSGDLFNKLSGTAKIGLKTKILNNLNTREIPRLAASFKNLSPTRVATVLNDISVKGLKKVIKDPNISEVWRLVLKEFQRIGTKEKNLETFLKLRSRGKAFFDDAIQLVKDSNVKQKLLDNLAKGDEIFKSDIQNIKYTASKSTGEVKIINKNNGDEIASIVDGQLIKKKFIERGIKIGDKRHKILQDGNVIGFGRVTSVVRNSKKIVKLANVNDLGRIDGNVKMLLIDETGNVVGQLKRVIGKNGIEIRYFYTDFEGGKGLIKNQQYRMSPEGVPNYEIIYPSQFPDLNLRKSKRILYGDLQMPKAVNDNVSGLGKIMAEDAYVVLSKKVGIDGFYGLWIKDAKLYAKYGGESINLTKFKEALSKGMTKEKASFQTITGKFAAKKGLNKVEFEPTFNINNLDEVHVIFYK